MMKQMLKRTGAFFLSLCLTLSVWGVLTPLSAAAATSGDYEYSVNYDDTATITKYLGSGGDVTIPDTLDGYTVTEIYMKAFMDCTGLISVIIPNSVTMIGDDTFLGCTGLTSVTIPNSVTEIGSSIFYGCTGLTSVTIPNSVTEIGSSIFYDCTGLTTIDIPNSVTTIGNLAFGGCTGLTSIIIPDSVTEIGWGNLSNAFTGCTRLTSIVVGANNPNYSSKDGVLFNQDQTELVICPQGKSGSYTIPDSVTMIVDDAFLGCAKLTSVNIHNSVTTIGRDAFRYCTGLISVTISDSVTEIGQTAFDYCTKLISFTVGKDNPNYSSKDGVLFNKNQTELIQYALGKSGSYTIPDRVIEIGTGAFDGCTGLTSVNIGDSVTKIGTGAFYDCTGLTSVTIPNSVTEISWDAFARCTELISINIPDSVTKIGYDAFWHCANLTIYGYAGSYAERYATENNIPFTALPQLSDDTTGIVVQGTEETLPDGATLTAKQTASGEDAATYEITLTQNGQPIQPTGEVTVKIPLPESMRDKEIAVYRIEADGSRTDMNATVQNGCAVFVTDHFSKYVLEASDALLGDIDGDGKVSVTDALAILRMAVGLSAPVDNADLDGMNGVTVTDALTALRIAVGLA